MREIALDTETTGLDPAEGHRIIEIGCVEIYNRIRTGKIFHAYVNPERGVPAESFNIHGISGEFLRDKPLFTDVKDDFLDFIGNDPLVIHNAAFDMKFINSELYKLGEELLDMSRAVDTLIIARRKFPGSPANLDALCRRFEIDLSKREKHGALLDAELLADMYRELMGGSQESFKLDKTNEEKTVEKQEGNKKILSAREHYATIEEQELHEQFLQKMIKESLWKEAE